MIVVHKKLVITRSNVKRVSMQTAVLVPILVSKVCSVLSLQRVIVRSNGILHLVNKDLKFF